MKKASVLKVLNLISALYKLGEIDTRKKNKLLTLVMDGNEAAINKSLYDIRETSSCRDLIDEYLDLDSLKEGGKNYEED